IILLIPFFLTCKRLLLVMVCLTISRLGFGFRIAHFGSNPRPRSSPHELGCNRPVKKHRRVPMLPKVSWQACFVFAVLAAFLGGTYLEAQNQQVAATLSGAITDPTGLALRGAKVTLTSVQNGVIRHF